MSDWWKAPVLQGEDNEYGDYDYLIEDIPHDSVEWNLNKYTSRCDSCGKERHLVLRSVSYFYTLDGYDYMDYNECWVCRLKCKIWSIKNRIKKKLDVIKDAYILARTSSVGNFKYYYNMIKEVQR